MIVGPIGNSVQVTASTSSANEAITVGRAAVVAVGNPGSAVAYVAFGKSAPTVTASDYPILPGEKELIAIGPGITHCGALMASGTADIEFTPVDVIA
jgi:hypothetical protein